jgi:Xaa-Pro aminopeptidase
MSWRHRRHELIDDLMTALDVNAVIAVGCGTVGGHAPVSWGTGYVPDHRGAAMARRHGESTTLFVPVGAPRTPAEPNLRVRTAAADESLEDQLAGFVTREDRIGVVAPTAAGVASLVTLLQPLSAAVVPISAEFFDVARTLDPTGTRAVGRARAMVESALRRGIDQTRVGMSEREVAAEVSHELTRLGATLQIVHVAFQDFTADRPGDRRASAGDLVTIFAEAAEPHGGWAEAGASIALGAADAGSAEIVTTLESALAAGRRAAEPGASYGHVARAMLSEITRIGVPTIGLGHSTGIDQGRITIHPESTELVRIGDAFCLHPSVRSPQGLSAGIAATVLVDEVVTSMSSAANHPHTTVLRGGTP